MVRMGIGTASHGGADEDDALIPELAGDFSWLALIADSDWQEHCPGSEVGWWFAPVEIRPALGWIHELLAEDTAPSYTVLVRRPFAGFSPFAALRPSSISWRMASARKRRGYQTSVIRR